MPTKLFLPLGLSERPVVMALDNCGKHLVALFDSIDVMEEYIKKRNILVSGCMELKDMKDVTDIVSYAKEQNYNLLVIRLIVDDEIAAHIVNPDKFLRIYKNGK